MENTKNSNYFVDKYNFSRRVVDHRAHYDFNYSINNPVLSPAWRLAWKQRMMGNIMYTFGIWVSGCLSVGLPFAIYLDAYYRSKTEDSPTRQSKAFAPSSQYGERFIMNQGNQTSGKGRWNYTHFCWENEPGCGKDFDWIKEETKSD